MNDDVLERELRSWFDSHTEPDVPASLRQFLASLPKTQAGVHPVVARSPILPATRRRDLAYLLVAAAVALALGVGLIAGGFLAIIKPTESPTSSRLPASPGPSSRAASGPYLWSLVSATGDVSEYGAGPVLRRSDGSLLAIGMGQEVRALTSTDGRTWAVAPADPGLTAAAPNHLSLVSGLAQKSARLVAVGATALDDISSGDARAWTSTDGLTWQVAPTSAAMIDAAMESVAAGPGGFVAVGSDGFPGGNTQLPGARGAAAWVSSDGLSWTRVPSQASFEGAVMFGVRTTAAGYVAWGEIHDPGGASPALPPIWTSADGQKWQRATGIADAGGPGDPIQSITASGDRLVAVGSRRVPESAGGGFVPAAWLSEDDGRSWRLASSPEASGTVAISGGLRDVAVSGSDLLAVGRVDAADGGSTAIAWRSTDQGSTWAALPDEPSFAGSLMERVIGVDADFVVFGSADDPNAVSNPHLIWLAEMPAGPAPTPEPAAETVRYVGFANASVGWAVTNGRLVLTDDGGTTWRTAGPPVDYAGGAPKGASFRDADHGWVVSEDGFSNSLSLWRTVDGGARWEQTILPAVRDSPETMGDAHTFWIDDSHAVIDVAGGMPNGFADDLLVTADGGGTWSPAAMRSITSGADGITGDVAFIDPQVGWIAGGAPGTRLWATRDGGDTWTIQQLAAPTGYLNDQGSFWGAPTFFDQTNGVVARTFDNNQSTILVIYGTTDSGRSWQALTSLTPSISSWSFPSQADWILWDPYHATMLRSTDQAGSWTRGVPAGLPSDAAPVMTDELHGWTISTGNPGLFVTSDGGSTWTAVDPLSARPASAAVSPGQKPSEPPTELTLTGAFTATISGMGNPGICQVSANQSGISLISPEPVQVTQGQFVRISIWFPSVPGTYRADSLIGPDGSGSVQANVLTNPAGGGGDPPWQAVDGSVTVTVASDLWNPGHYGVVAGTLQATLRREGQPDLHVSGRWGCIDASQVASRG